MLSHKSWAGACDVSWSHRLFLAKNALLDISKELCLHLLGDALVILFIFFTAVLFLLCHGLLITSVPARGHCQNPVRAKTS